LRVAILDDIHAAYESTGGVRRLRERAAVEIFTMPLRSPGELRGFDALIANRERTRFTRALLAQLTDVRIIAQTGNHAHHIDFAAARERGIVVAKASGGYSIGAAELSFGLAIAVMRQIPVQDVAVRRGDWRPPYTRVLHGKTMGIVGLGQVGRHVARIAAAFGMRTLAWGPRLTTQEATTAGAEWRPLDDLLRESDVVTLHASLSGESRGLIGEARLRLMKPTACLVNTARGGLIDEAALLDALRERRIGGAGLDVFEEEPVPPGHPFTMLPNVVLTPHLGWPTDEAYERFAAAACDVLLAYLDGRDVPQFTESASYVP
jgi:phosphoglycerate dehydrogenase-like enzyme